MVKGKNLDKKLEKELKNRIILVTGGAGSVGAVLVKKILQYPVTSSKNN